MSYAPVVSHLTSESVFDEQTQRHDPNGRMPSTHQNRTFHTPLPTSINATPETEAGLVSELHSSKSEVEAIKTQMAQMEKDKQVQIQEREKRAQQENSDNNARVAEQQKLMEAQAEAQRREFEQNWRNNVSNLNNSTSNDIERWNIEFNNKSHKLSKLIFPVRTPSLLQCPLHQKSYSA